MFKGKIAFFTAGSTHHLYFLSELVKIASHVEVVQELNRLSPPFNTHHPFEDERETYEAELFFSSKVPTLKDLANTYSVPSINEDSVVNYLSKLKPDLILVLGTGKIHSKIITPFKDIILNFHGGNPEEYRGLDSHLWSIYHHDFDQITTTLHQLNDKLDDGEIILSEKLKLSAGMKLAHLRSVNIKACVNMTSSFLKGLDSGKPIKGTKQDKRGRYYSFMPSMLKETCISNFDKFISKLV